MTPEQSAQEWAKKADAYYEQNFDMPFVEEIILSMTSPSLVELFEAREELRQVDEIIARRPALNKPTRKENIEHCINTAKTVDALRSELTQLRAKNRLLVEFVKEFEDGVSAAKLIKLSDALNTQFPNWRDEV